MLPSKRINQKLDLILQKFEVLPAPQGREESALMQRVRALLASNQMIEAVKVYREATGVGLKEAKDAVDAIERELKRRWGFTPAAPGPPRIWREVRL